MFPPSPPALSPAFAEAASRRQAPGETGITELITYPSGRVITYTPDQIGRISQVSTTVNGNPKTLASAITYLPYGGITGLTYGNGLALTQGFDNQYRISSIVTGSILNLAYGYDANGNITSVTNPDPPGGEVLEPWGVYTYQTGTNKLTHIEGTSPIDFGYDANANVTSETGWTYIYDLSNQLIRVLQGTTQVAEYTYNGAGQRIKKVTQTETRIYHYDLKGHLIAETNQTGQMLAEYIYLGDQFLAMIKPGELAYYFHNDHLGTPQVLTDDSQAIAWKAVYTPFGQAVASIQMVENPFRFPGQYYDSETGLHYNYFRYYNPQTGRYLTPDPIGLEGGINLFAYVDSVGKPFYTNLYTYVAGNPVRWIDPWGLDPIDPRTGRDNPVLRCHVVTHNDPAENLKGALILAGVAGGLTLGPEVPAIARSLYYWLTVTYLKDPTTYNNIAEGFLTPGPSPTTVGNIGTATKIGFDWAYYSWKTYYNVSVRNNPAECDPCH